MIMQAFPASSVIKPAVAGRRDELVCGKLVQYMTVAYTPVGVFEGSEHGPDHIHLCIIIIFRTHLVVESLVEVGATSQDQH